MEHITMTEVNEKIVRLTPDPGYCLKDKISGNTHSEAYVTPRDAARYTAEEV